MILADIRRYLEQHRRAALQDIALRFDSDPDAVRGMLEQWIRKGKVRLCRASAACGSSCSKCGPDAVEIYEWIGAGQAAGQSVDRQDGCGPN